METFGRYQLLKTLATGGMGVVYLARQQGPVGFEKLLVVKRLLPHLSHNQDFIDMFFDEARIAANLNHPNIAQIYDLGDVDGLHYIAMEYVHGDSLRQLWTRTKRVGIPLGITCRIIADAAAGLDFAHRAKGATGRPLNVIHRDVSPHNILVGFNGGVKLIDFGVAKATGKVSNTISGDIKGKCAYMSPEQARGGNLDHRSDIFGLGIILHELLTRARLFKRESELATLKAVINARVEPPTAKAEGLPKELDPIVMKALAKDRDQRYRTAGELQLALENFIVQQRLSATPAHVAAFMRSLYGPETPPAPPRQEKSARPGEDAPPRARAAPKRS